MNNKVTIQKVSDEIAEYLRDKGVTSEGNKFLKAGKILKDAGILEHLIMMHDNGLQDQVGLLDLVEKSVSIGRIIKGEVATGLPVPTVKEIPYEPEDNDPPPMFGA